jgi:hypothetical protein
MRIARFPYAGIFTPYPLEIPKKQVTIIGNQSNIRCFRIGIMIALLSLTPLHHFIGFIGLVMLRLLFVAFLTLQAVSLAPAHAFPFIADDAEQPALIPFDTDPKLVCSVDSGGAEAHRITKQGLLTSNSKAIKSSLKKKIKAIVGTSAKGKARKTKLKQTLAEITSCKATTLDRLALQEKTENSLASTGLVTPTITSITNPIQFNGPGPEFTFTISGSGFFPPFSSTLTPSSVLLIQLNSGAAITYPLNYIDANTVAFKSLFVAVAAPVNVNFFIVNYLNGAITLSNVITATILPVGSATPTPTPTPKPSPTPTVTPTASPTTTPTATPSITPTPSSYKPIRSIDCGDLNGDAAVEVGYELLSDVVFPPGITLDKPVVDIVHVGKFIPTKGYAYPAGVSTIDPDQMYKRHLHSAIVLQDDTVITVANLVPNGGYRLLLELGALAPWMEFEGQWKIYPSVSRGLTVDVKNGASWITLATDINARAPDSNTSFTTTNGGVIPVWVRANADSAGVVHFRLRTTTSDPVIIAGFEVHAYEALPIAYKKTTGSGPLLSSIPTASSFIAAFNNGDFNSAQGLALNLSDPFLRGTALSHLIGWLDGSRDNLYHLIPSAQDALEDARAQGHAGAAYLLAQLETFARGIDHFAVRGYTWYELCENKGYLNPTCADQLPPPINAPVITLHTHIALRLLSALIAPVQGDTILDSVKLHNQGIAPILWEPSPFAFAAAKEFATGVIRINPQLSFNTDDVGSVEMQERSRDIFSDLALDFASSHFSKDLEIPLLYSYLQNGKHPIQWTKEQWPILSDTQIAQAWWSNDVALLPDESSAPNWADDQRNFARLHENFARYWLQERFQNGEFGGGQGDDVELMLQLFPLFAARLSTSDKPLLDSFHAAIRFGLETNTWVENGIYSGDLVDAEHASEFTTNLYYLGKIVYGHNAAITKIAFENARHLLDPIAPQLPLLGVSNTGRVHFTSYHYNKDGPSTDPALAIDLPLNLRTFVPALSAAFYVPVNNTHPLITDLTALALGWREDALLTPGAAWGKPEGFLFAPKFPSNQPVNNIWYSEQGKVGDTSMLTLSQGDYVLELLRMAYRTSTASDKWRYLLPALRQFRAVMDWENAGQPVASVGSLHWAAKLTKGNLGFGTLVSNYYRELANDPQLTTLPDPFYSNDTTYVDAALLTRMQTWTKDEYLYSSGPALKYALMDVAPCSAAHGKNPNAVGQTFKDAITYYRNFFPLFTKYATRTDRVFANPLGAPRELFTTWTGERLVEGKTAQPWVRWKGDTRNIAMQMNRRNYDGTSWGALVQNFNPTAATVEVWLDEGMAPGVYQLKRAASSGTCDTFQSTPSVLATLSKKGAVGAGATIQIPPGLNQIEIHRTGNETTPSKYDLQVGLDMVLEEEATSHALHIALNVINVGASASPSASIELWAEATDTAGVILASPAPNLIYTGTVPTLAASSGWTIAESTKALTLANTPWLTTLTAGNRINLRAKVTATNSEFNPQNNLQERGFILETIPVE